MDEFINITPDNINNEHLCCIIRRRKLHPGVEEKRKWLSERLKEGHVFRKLNVDDKVFIEYAPLEKAWVPITGDNYYYIYCLWVNGSYKKKGYGKKLMEYCLEDAKAKGKSGVCMLGAKKQKGWLSDQSFAKKFGFEVVDTTDNGYELLALSFDGTIPKFASNVKKEKIENYEQNNDVILQRDRYKTNEQKNNEVKGKDEVDRDLQQIIIEEMRKLYEECSEMYIKIQILDRGIFIRDLLENFDSNIEYMKQRNKEVER